MTAEQKIEQSYALARERYAELGVNTDQALRTLRSISLSLHCWQGDAGNAAAATIAKFLDGDGTEVLRCTVSTIAAGTAIFNLLITL